MHRLILDSVSRCTHGMELAGFSPSDFGNEQIPERSVVTSRKMGTGPAELAEKQAKSGSFHSWASYSKLRIAA